MRSMYYACEFGSVGWAGCLRYELVAIDHERDRQFVIGFTIDPTIANRFLAGARAYVAAMHDGCEARMWRAIKQESPGTFLEARALGWVPEIAA